jgi:hypothetical protein
MRGSLYICYIVSDPDHIICSTTNNISPDYSQRNLVVGKAKVKYQVKRIFIRCMRYFSFNAAHDQISKLFTGPQI